MCLCHPELIRSLRCGVCQLCSSVACLQCILSGTLLLHVHISGGQGWPAGCLCSAAEAACRFVVVCAPGSFCGSVGFDSFCASCVTPSLFHPVAPSIVGQGFCAGVVVTTLEVCVGPDLCTLPLS